MLFLDERYVTYTDDSYYISGRFEIRITTILMVGLRVNGMKYWNYMPYNDMAWKGMLFYIIIHNIIFIA